MVHKVIAKNIKENHIENVVIVPKGVGDKNFTTEIQVSDFCLDSSLVSNNYIQKGFTTTVPVEIITLDSFVSQNNIQKVDFIKMDIEGFEELAIRGAHEVIKKFKPVWSISSYHTDFVNEKQHPKLVKLLKSYNYTIEEEGSRHIFAY